MYYILIDVIIMEFKIPFDIRRQTEPSPIGKVVRVEDEPTNENFADANMVLQQLTEEEANLIEERKRMQILKEKLQSNVKRNIDEKTKNIQKLRDEIKDLRLSCEGLNKTISCSKA